MYTFITIFTNSYRITVFSAPFLYRKCIGKIDCKRLLELDNASVKYKLYEDISDSRISRISCWGLTRWPNY